MANIFFYSDSPIATTGLGRVTRYIIPQIAKHHKVTQVATNHHSVTVDSTGVHANYDRSKYEWDIISTYLNNDAWGVDICKRILSTVKFDIIFTSCDINRAMPFYREIKLQQENGAKWLLYTPIDRNNILKGEEKVFNLADKLVVLSRFAKEKLEQRGLKDVEYLYHPVDFEIYKPIERQKDIFKQFTNKNFIIGNINRNQFRKDLVRTLAVFKDYSKTDKSARLYLHTKQIDEGGDLSQNINELDLFEQDIEFADIKDASQGISDEELNGIYNGLDVMLTTSKGEGFGYSTAEAMACKIPIVAPNNTSFTEMLEGRGYLVDCKEWVVDYGISNCQRYISDIEGMSKALTRIRTQPEEAKQKAEDAYKWARENFDMEKINNRWLKILNDLDVPKI